MSRISRGTLTWPAGDRCSKQLIFTHGRYIRLLPTVETYWFGNSAKYLKKKVIVSFLKIHIDIKPNFDTLNPGYMLVPCIWAESKASMAALSRSNWLAVT